MLKRSLDTWSTTADGRVVESRLTENAKILSKPGVMGQVKGKYPYSGHRDTCQQVNH